MVGVLEALSGWLLVRTQRAEPPSLVVGCVQLIWGGFCLWGVLSYEYLGWRIAVPLCYLGFLFGAGLLGYRLSKQVQELEDPMQFRIPVYYGGLSIGFGVGFAALSVAAFATL